MPRARRRPDAADPVDPSSLDATERRERIAALRTWQQTTSREWDDNIADFPPDVLRAWDANAAELRELEDLERDHIREVAADSRHREGGYDPGHVGRDRDDGMTLDPRVRADREAGLRTVDRFASAGALESRSADLLDGMLRERDPSGVGARYLAAVGSPHYEQAFAKILRDPVTAQYRFTPAEADAVRRVTEVEAERALVEGTGSAGGFAVPFQLDPSIIHTSSGAINPIRELARLVPVTTNIWKGVAADAPTAAYQAEAAEVADASPTLVQPTVQVATGRAFVPASFEVWMDWAGIVQELTSLLLQARDILDATKFLSGSGTNEPAGILGTSGLTTTQRIQTATVATFVVGDVYTFKQAIGSTVFMPGATWVAHPNTLDTIYRFVASGSTTEPQLMPDGRNGPLLGKPTRELSTMATGTTTGTKLAIFGDWSGFQVSDRIGATVEIIGNLFGATNRFPTGQRGLLLWWRTGTGVIAPNKLRYLEVK